MSLIHHESLIEWPFVEAIGDPVIPDGIASTAALGSPSLSLSIDLAGMGIASTAQCGSPLILPGLANLPVVIYIGGVDRTNLVEIQDDSNRGINRSMRISGGSKCTCEFVLNNKKAALYRPEQGEEVLIHTQTGRFFAGVVDKISEMNFSGSVDLSKITVFCADYGSLLDRVIVGREFQTAVGNDPTILTYQVAIRYFERFGIQYQFTGFPPFGGLDDVIFNWITGTEAMNRIAQESGGDWRVDFHKTLYLFGPDGYQAAPFSISQDDGNWISMTVDVDSSRYRNRIGVKTSQNTRPLWTDTFTVVAGEFLWITMAPLSSKPIILVDDVPAVVVDFEDIGTVAYDFYWIGTTVISNPASLPAAGTVLEVKYPSPLSYVVWAEDADEIAEHGTWEAIETIPDVPTGAAMQAYAEALLARRLVRPTTLTIITDRDGLEAGMQLTVNTARPLASGEFLITEVTSAEVAKSFFRHTVKAVDTASQLTDVGAFERAILAAIQQPRDRVMEHIFFQIAETVEGQDNPGLTVGVKQAIRTAPADGVGHSVTLFFNLADDENTVDDCIIDVLQNGVSIFPVGDANKLIWPAGERSIQIKLDFLADPFEINKGDRFTIEVIEADGAAHDGTLDLAMLVR